MFGFFLTQIEHQAINESVFPVIKLIFISFLYNKVHRMYDINIVLPEKVIKLLLFLYFYSILK